MVAVRGPVNERWELRGKRAKNVTGHGNTSQRLCVQGLIGGISRSSIQYHADMVNELSASVRAVHYSWPRQVLCALAAARRRIPCRGHPPGRSGR